MMESKTYNLCLIGNDVRDEFLEEIEDKYSILSVPKNIPSVMIVSLTESEREELLKHIYVMSIEEQLKVYPASTVVYTPIQFEDKIVTTEGPSSTTEIGSNYVSAIHKYMTNGTGIDETLGSKGDNSDQFSGTSYRSFLSGEHVDIVSMEAVFQEGTPINYHKTHPEYNALGELRSDGTITPGTGGSRCVPMDWISYNPSMGYYSLQNVFTGAIYRPNEDQSSYMLGSHSAAVLSCAGGQVGGLAKKASLRVIYLAHSNGVATCCEAIINWHKSKPTNPITGQKNPTIVIGEFQYVRGNTNAVKISDIASFQYRGTTTTRPNVSRNPGLNGWLLSDFVEKDMLPKLVPTRQTKYNPDGTPSVIETIPEWCISFDGSPTLADADVSSYQALADNGIHFICAAGNDCGVHANRYDADYDNSITTTSEPHDYLTYQSSADHYSVEERVGSDTYFYYRSLGPAGTNPFQIDVGAYQASETTPSTDGYSVRGPVIDIFGLGAGTWSSSPDGPEYNDGHKYGMFSGTSAAAPTVVGVAACILEYQYLTTGSYPDPGTLKSLLLGAADQSRVKNYETIDWSNPSYSVLDPFRFIDFPRASNLISPNDSRDALILAAGRRSPNGSLLATDLVGSTTRGAFLPDVYRNYFPPNQGGSGNVVPDPVQPASVPGACIHPTIKGPTGSMSSPPYNYAQSYDKYEGGRGSPGGIYFQPKGEESNYPPENISYINFRLRMRSFGPRGGNGETIYLTSNRGNRDPNKGNVRKWYTDYQSVVDREPDKWTTNRGEAFVPFRIHFRVGFVAGGDGAYRILYSDHYHDWYNFEYKDIDFDSSEMGRQNNLPSDGSGKIIFPDFGLKNYTQPRIFEIKADIYNLDLNPNQGEAKNRINMFAQATDDANKARESQVLEFGKYIIT